MLALDQFYRQYYKQIVRRIAYLTGNVHIAEELAQEVFVKLYTNPPEHENVLSWLYTVAARTAYNYLRDDQIHRQKEQQHFESQMDIEGTPEAMMIENETIKSVHDSLATLSTRDRTCLLMKHSGYKYAEIAACLEVEINAIGMIISRAQAKLKRNYEKRIEQEGVL